MKLMESILVLHPYYKFAYIKLAWGGEVEQVAECAAGNSAAKNWQDEARKLIEKEVSNILLLKRAIESNINWFQMEKYWKNTKQPQAPLPVAPTVLPTSGENGSASVLSDYNQYWLTLLSSKEHEGWEAELRRYEKDMPADVSPDMDVVKCGGRYVTVCPYYTLQVFYL